MEIKKEAVIALSDFNPPESVTINDKEEMIENPEFLDRVHPKWKYVREKGKNIIFY